MIFKRKTLVIILIAILLFAFPLTVIAHSGRTDSRGGHHDYKNKSGLGSYHYHCGGHSAHLHPNGICPYAPKDYITITKFPSTLYVGDTDTYNFTMHSYYNDFSYTVSSSDNSIVKIDNYGNISAVGVGTATITIKTSHTQKQVTVKVKEVFANELKINTSIEKLQIGDTYKLNCTILPSNTTNKKLTYSSSDKSIATVSSNGTIKGISSGTATITVTTSNNISKSIEITIFEVLPNDIKCEESINLIVGDEHKLEVQILPNNANNKKYFVESDDANIITCSDLLIQAIKEGDTTIHVETWNGITKDIPIHIDFIPVIGVDIEDKTDYIFANIVDISNNIDLKAQIIPQDATYKDVVWNSSNPSVLLIEDNNFVPKTMGKTTITCTNIHENISESINIVVIDINVVIIISCGCLVILIGIFLYYRKTMHCKNCGYKW